jgi:Flp pilus assembly protein TadB
MVNDGDRPGTAWGRVALAILALIIVAMVVSLLLRLIKLLVYAALLLVGVTVVLRALRSRR